MNDTQILAHPAVEAFVEEVRARLGDLSDEQREELLDGLAADLTEQLADGADGVLDDPAEYAAELRSAAGLPEQRRTLPRLQVPTPQRVEATLDRARTWWLTRVDESQVWEVIEALRPAWWVARAWVAVTLMDQATGWWEPVSLVPSFDVPGLGLLLLVVAVVGSVLVGLGRLWPASGPDRSALARVVLVLLNLAAVLAPLTFSLTLPGYLHGLPHGDYSGYSAGYHDAARENESEGLLSDGDPVRNVFAYDAKGQPLRGIQLFDQNGQPLALSARQATEGRGDARQVGCPWLNGTSALYNVFPLAERLQRDGTCTATDGGDGAAAFPTPPLAQVPPVSRPEAVPEPAQSVRAPKR